MEAQEVQDQRDAARSHALVVLLLGFVAPFGVLFFSGLAEAYLRAFYAVALAGLMFWLIASQKPTMFVQEVRAVESRAFLHPIFQAVRLPNQDRCYAKSYMFVYGGKRLVPGRRYVFAVLPRSTWILSAHEAPGPTASKQ